MSATSDAGKGALLTLFLVTMIDMIGFGIIIPFLTYLVQDWPMLRAWFASVCGWVC